jgi:hypothetical protein
VAFKPYCDRCKTWHTESEGHRETAICTLCAGVESPGFYTGCMVRDGHITDWQCDGNGNLSRPVRARCASLATTAAMESARGYP